MSTTRQVPQEVTGLTIIKNAYPERKKAEKPVRKPRRVLPVERRPIQHYVDLWGLSYTTVWRWTQKKYMNPPLPSVKIGHKVLIPVEAGERWIREYGKRTE